MQSCRHIGPSGAFAVVVFSAFVRTHMVMDRAQIIQSNRLNAKGLPVDSSSSISVFELRRTQSSTSTVVRDAVTLRSAPPFVLSHDLLRGIVYAGRAALQFAFMLTVMYVLVFRLLRRCCLLTVIA